MDYKKSMYNVEVDKLEDGRKLVFNTVTSAYAILDEKNMNICDSISELNGELSEEEIPNINKMKEIGFIVDKDYDEFKNIKVEENISKYGNRHSYITIAPTMDCNMACPYCYEEGEKYISMDEPTQIK